MPDLNLIDEGGFDESQAPAAPPARMKGGGGGGNRTMLIVVVVLVIAAAGVYFLNQRGVIHLWGKKAQPVTQMQEEPFPQEFTEQAQEQGPRLDTTEVALLDTQPVEEKVEGAKGPEKIAESDAKKNKEQGIGREPVLKLSEMKGEFTVQVVAYREKKNADETAKNLEYAGYPSFVEKVPMKGGDWFTVRIGRYATPDDAKKAVKTFAGQLQSHHFIDKIRVK